ncbi:2-phospho-L-lactate guanylyltransferase [Bradyrhizobium sp. CSA207]|uniref:2-phospho-L-lactate guanylyltransferase n=1 Tax=Bradyrhizobium sp. CSA207 TaxID=2698826 RepID=UPI0023B01974|nr:2-phospho-L-lactate guanylyltransferase [Bradyrhizobium sp. CSA207]MDE5445771.1 2-phospho-L-lactate guanylyltransferase [Bradyrhizobium sp. CSA207]
MDIIVPVKRFSEAKTRLAGALLPAERVKLARLLVATVIEQLARVRGVRRVTLASSEPSLVRMAAPFGFEVLPDDPLSPGLNAAVDRAVKRSVADGANDVGIVFADLPLFDAEEFEGILKQHLDGAPVQTTIVMDRLGAGTNVRLSRPGDLLPPLYGRNSAVEYQRAAALKTAEIRLVESACLSHDLDHFADIQAVLKVAGHHVLPPTLRSMLTKWVERDAQERQNRCA